MKTVGIIGNPNCGKTTLFNGLTGSHQHIGNWPGVTVEKKEGEAALPSGEKIKIVDLPGIYSLTTSSEDEKASLEYLLSREADLYVNVLDATTLERNLYLTLLLCELKVPMVVAVTMVDIARHRDMEVELDHLSEHLGVPVIGVNATKEKDLASLAKLLAEALPDAKVPSVKIDYGNELEQEIDILSAATIKTAEGLRATPRWVAVKTLEGDPFIRRKLEEYHDMAPEVVDGAIARVTSVLADPPDVELAEARYGIISGLVRDVVKVTRTKTHVSELIDKFVLNRLLGIPVFFGLMYLVFWFTQIVGGAFVDFFDIAGGTIFVDGAEYLMNLANAPDWLTAIVANGAGTALQTICTFLPPVGFMFLALATLEDSGYMARAAFVMDRFMRWIGLPGKSFVPMLVGFGCSVPAIMATRTLESKRDRFLTVFMVPFMSCGAKLPVWVLFAASFCPENPGKLVFLMYATGIVLGIATGLLLKHTLFRGEPTHFIMELPPYHCPRPRHIFLHAWERLRIFVWRAGKFIVPMVLVLGILNSVGPDGTVGAKSKADSSVLAVAGKAITPVFGPMGVERDNWQASVALFTGLFAKESVIGTMKGLYGHDDALGAEASEAGNEAGEYSLIGGIKEAFATIPENLSGVFPFSVFLDGDGKEEEDAEEEDEAAIGALRRHFPGGFHQMFSYLLFVLLYVPCLAATGVVFREIGKFYGMVFVAYLTLLGWSVATVYHAVMVTQSAFWLMVGSGIIAAMFGGFWAYGRRHKVDML